MSKLKQLRENNFNEPVGDLCDSNPPTAFPRRLPCSACVRKAARGVVAGALGLDPTFGAKIFEAFAAGPPRNHRC